MPSIYYIPFHDHTWYFKYKFHIDITTWPKLTKILFAGPIEDSEPEQFRTRIIFGSVTIEEADS